MSVSLERCEAVPEALVVMKGMAGAETGGTAGTGSRVDSGRKAATEVAVSVAAAAAGEADFVPKVWTVLLLWAVLAVLRAAEAGQRVWLDAMESESAVGS